METSDWKRYRRKINPQINRNLKEIDKVRSQLPEECVFRKGGKKARIYPLQTFRQFREHPKKICLFEKFSAWVVRKKIVHLEVRTQVKSF